MTISPRDQSTGTLLSDIAQHLTRLVRGELSLARAKAEQRLRNAVVGLGFVGVAVILAGAAVNLAAGALVAAAIRAGLTPGWAALAVGTGLALIAWGFLRYGLRLSRILELGAGTLPADHAARSETLADAEQNDATP